MHYLRVLPISSARPVRAAWVTGLPPNLSFLPSETELGPGVPSHTRTWLAPTRTAPILNLPLRNGAVRSEGGLGGVRSSV